MPDFRSLFIQSAVGMPSLSEVLDSHHIDGRLWSMFISFVRINESNVTPAVTGGSRRCNLA